ARLSAARITVVARRAAAVDAIRPAALGVPLAGADWPTAVEHTAADVLISTVPTGVADALATVATFRPDAVVVDVLYNPWPTLLAAAAAAAGCRVVSGLDLLLAQAIGQFERFAGVAAPRAAMAAALDRARASGGSSAVS
ncbi:MAG TPA: shikimate dehydrogenase, partial [Micromonosporaceae bacterium]